MKGVALLSSSLDIEILEQNTVRSSCRILGASETAKATISIQNCTRDDNGSDRVTPTELNRNAKLMYTRPRLSCAHSERERERPLHDQTQAHLGFETLGPSLDSHMIRDPPTSGTLPPHFPVDSSISPALHPFGITIVEIFLVESGTILH